MKRLCPLLTQEELEAANLLYDPEPRAKPPKQVPTAPEPEKNAAAANASLSSEQEAKTDRTPSGTGSSNRSILRRRTQLTHKIEYRHTLKFKYKLL
jgi:proline racemase